MTLSRRSEVTGNVNPVLTNLALGYKSNQYIAREIIPQIPCYTDTGQVPIIGKEGFQVIDTLRGLKASPAKVGGNYDYIKYAVEDHALEEEIDRRGELEPAEEIGAKQVLKLKERAGKRVSHMMEGSLEKSTADILFSEDYYEATNKITLTGGDKLSDYTNSDVFGVFDDAKEKAESKMGVEPNVLVIGWDTYTVLRRHPQLLNKLSVSERKHALNQEQIATLLEFDKIYIGKANYTDKDKNFIKLWGDKASLIYKPQSEEIEAPFHTAIMKKQGSLEVREIEREVTVAFQQYEKWQVLNLSKQNGFLISDIK